MKLLLKFVMFFISNWAPARPKTRQKKPKKCERISIIRILEFGTWMIRGKNYIVRATLISQFESSQTYPKAELSQFCFASKTEYFQLFVNTYIFSLTVYFFHNESSRGRFIISLCESFQQQSSNFLAFHFGSNSPHQRSTSVAPSRQ